MGGVQRTSHRSAQLGAAGVVAAVCAHAEKRSLRRGQPWRSTAAEGVEVQRQQGVVVCDRGGLQPWLIGIGIRREDPSPAAAYGAPVPSDEQHAHLASG
jgi:hypothetical protein